MTDKHELLVDERQGPRNSLVLALLSLIVGAFAGIVGAIFRIGLQRADALRNSFIERAHAWGSGGFFLIVCGTALAAGIAAWLVQRFAPESRGAEYLT
jgi:CIC family chloride channel protein